MAPKKKVLNGYSVFMMETRQKLMSQGAKVSMADMSEYCKEDWENMPVTKKEEYKMKCKKNNDGKVAKYTSLGENVEEVKKRIEDVNLQAKAMYAYIDVLLDMQPASHYLPKQKFILIHINSYTSEQEQFYFPAEICMAEFSLEKGLIRMFHQLVGFDRVRTNAPPACSADIKQHATNNHKIDLFSVLPTNYTELLLKMIGFIMNRDVDETILDDLTLDMPPIYTAHSPIQNELMITSASLFRLFKSAVRGVERSDFNNIIRVYHLDKLFMNLKNACYKVKCPDEDELALPSVSMASLCFSKVVIDTIESIGCNLHEQYEPFDGCSNYFICKWINIISAHCCRYLDIELVPGCHYDFCLSKTDSPIEKHFGKMKISKFSDDYSDNRKIDKLKTVAYNSAFSAQEGELSTIIQKPIRDMPEDKSNTNSNSLTDNEDNFLQLGDLKNIQKDAPVTIMNNWKENAGRGRCVISQRCTDTQKKK